MKTSKCEVCNTEFTSKNPRKTCSQKCRYILANKNTDRHKAHKNAQKTWIRKYGNDNPMRVKECKEKFEQSMIETYGVPYSQQSKELRNKTQQTWIRNFGVDNPMKCNSVRDKTHNTLQKKYGHKHALQNKECLEKFKDTCYKRYGVYNPNQRHYTNKENYNRDYILENFTTNGKVSIKDRLHFKEYFNIKSDEVLKLIALGIPYEKAQGESIGEKSILKILKEKYFDFTFKENNKNLIFNPDTLRPLELDILVYKDKSILCAVEYNGVYWHNKENPLRENLKSKLCKAKGFELFHIWEDTIIEDLHNVFEYLDCFVD